jgi:hypothetical protein
MFGFIAPVLSAVSGFFGTTAGAAVATGAATAAVSAVAQAEADKKRNAAAEAAYQRQLAEQQKERDRQAAIDAANKAEQLAIDEKNRATAKADAANKYVDMNAAAQKAGLNPLTVLRATGGTGFGAYGGYGAVMRQGLVQPTVSAPILSSTSVASQIGLGAIKGFIDYKTNQRANEHYDRLNQLDLEQRQLDIKLSKQQLKQMNAPEAVMPSVGSMPTTGGNIKTTELPMTIQGLETLVTGALSRVTKDSSGSYVDNELRATTVPYTTRSGRVVNLPGDEMDIGSVMIGTGIEAIDGMIQLYDNVTGAVGQTRVGQMSKRAFENLRDLNF